MSHWNPSKIKEYKGRLRKAIYALGRCNCSCCVALLKRYKNIAFRLGYLK